MPRRRPHVSFPCSGRRCRPAAPPARRLGPPRAQCHSSCRSMAFSRVSPSPKRCQAKAGSGWGKGSWPGSLCSVLDCLWEPSRWGYSLSRPPGPLASASSSLQTQHPCLNNGFCPGSLGAGWSGLLGDEIWSSRVAPNTGRWTGAENSEKQPGLFGPSCLEEAPRPSPGLPLRSSGGGPSSKSMASLWEGQRLFLRLQGGFWGPPEAIALSCQ